MPHDYKKVPRWITSWPEWYGVSGNVEVVPASDYDALCATPSAERDRLSPGAALDHGPAAARGTTTTSERAAGSAARPQDDGNAHRAQVPSTPPSARPGCPPPGASSKGDPELTALAMRSSERLATFMTCPHCGGAGVGYVAPHSSERASKDADEIVEACAQAAWSASMNQAPVGYAVRMLKGTFALSSVVRQLPEPAELSKWYEEALREFFKTPDGSLSQAYERETRPAHLFAIRKVAERVAALSAIPPRQDEWIRCARGLFRLIVQNEAIGEPSWEAIELRIRELMRATEGGVPHG